MVNLALQNKFEMINGMLIFDTVALIYDRRPIGKLLVKLLLKQTIIRNYKNIVSKSAAFISATCYSFQAILLI